jgi:hypothetical protein
MSSDSTPSVRELEDRRQELVNEKIMLQARLAEISAEYFLGKPRLPRHIYVKACNTQADIKRRLREIEREIMALKPVLSEAKRNAYARKPAPAFADGIVMLVSLRNKYMEFAADLTRVGSMRQMAAQFANDLDNVIQAARDARSASRAAAEAELDMARKAENIG